MYDLKISGLYYVYFLEVVDMVPFHLFDKLEYAIVDPELFVLYAATDAFMTYQLDTSDIFF